MDNYSKYLCIFGGGAVRGYAFLGVLRAFKEIGFYPEKLAGSSVGAIFAAYYALDMPLEMMEKVFMDINFDLFRDINFSFSPAFSLSKGGVFLDWVRTNIEKTFYGENYKKNGNEPVKFKDLKRDLIILTTDIINCKTVVFSKETTPDFEVALAVRISTAMPGLMTPVEYEGKILADGDILKGKPMWCLNEELDPEGYRVLDLRLEGVKKDKKIKNMLDFANTVYSCMTNAPTEGIVERYSSCDKFDIIKIDTKDLILVDFNISDKLKNDIAMLGYISVMKFFKEELPQKRRTLFNIYSSIRERISAAEKILNDIKKVNFIFEEIFFILVDSRKQIERNIFKKIIKFKKIYDENISVGFLGIEKVDNKKFLKSEILKIKEILDEKCIELSN